MTGGDTPRRWLAHIALAAVMLTFVVIVASAWMRHERAGLDCGDWPACYGRVDALSSAAPVSRGVYFARTAHRIAATGVTALILALLLISWTQRPASKTEGSLAAVAMTTAAGLALLGVLTPAAHSPAVPLANLLGGYLLLAALAATYCAAAKSTSPLTSQTSVTGGASLLALVLIVLAFAQAMLGGFIGAQFATPACLSLPGCSGFRFDEWTAAIALDPFRPWQSANGRIVAVPGAAGLHVLHRLSGVVLVAGITALAWALRRDAPRIALVLFVLAIVAPALGAAAILAMPSLPLTVLHNAAAAAIVALLAGVAIRR